jgi:hypothetical protein
MGFPEYQFMVPLGSDPREVGHKIIRVHGFLFSGYFYRLNPVNVIGIFSVV